MEPKLWLIYAMATFGLALTPGPNSLLALTHGALYGARATVLTISGGVAGFGCLIALAMLGLGALLEVSSNALFVLKLVGGAYLLWLGIQLWRTPAMNLTLAADATPPAPLKLLRQGFMTAVANPKVLLFYGAFLPQFVDPTRSLLLQFAIMAATFGAVEFLVEWLIARLAARIRPWLERRGRHFNRCCGGMFALIGVALPVTR